MKLLLSGATFFMGEQKSPISSTGGFMSSTPVPNARMNFLFGDISIYGKMVGSKECMAIFLYNDTNENIVNLKLEQIIQTNSDCDFYWGAVSPTEGDAIQIEKINSRKEEPFNVEWFQPTTTREYSNCKVKLGGSIGDAVSLFDVEFELSGNTKESLVDDIVKAFKNNENFFVEKTSTESFLIQRRDNQETNELVELVTPGTAELFDSNLSGFEDGTTLIIEELKPKKAIAFWIKREIIKNDSCENEECEDISCKTNTKETLEVIFSYD
jgi:hypothetical protein